MNFVGHVKDEAYSIPPSLERRPLIINRNIGTVQMWNDDKNEYVTLTFEVIQDLYSYINNKENFPGIDYV